MSDTRSSPKLLNLDEVSERTRLPKATLRYHRHLKTGVMAKSFLVGRRVVVREDDLDAWIDEQYRRSA